MAQTANSANLDIDTNQPRPLRGLIVRGVRKTATIRTKKVDADGNETIMIVNEDDYDKELHGEKVDKLPSKKAKKAADKKTADKKTSGKKTAAKKKDKE